MKTWFKIENKGSVAEIWIYEQIGEDFWDGSGITAKGFQKELAEIKASQIDLHINSPGGLVFDGITIYNLLKNHPANVTTYIDGLAASIASVIALAGDKVVMAENALFMIHKASGMVMGTSDDMRDFAEKLDKVNGSIATTYQTKTKKEEAEINDLMAAETWMTATEALDFGFVDEIAGEADMAACAKFVPVMAKAGFQHIPGSIQARKEKPTAREAEKALRDVGFNQRDAKAILAEGIKDVQRDVEPTPEPPPEPQRDVARQRLNDPAYNLLLKGEKLLKSQGGKGI
jgi:ATP-dependent Clp endopeptidase proteolytic subunit ClpP